MQHYNWLVVWNLILSIGLIVSFIFIQTDFENVLAVERRLIQQEMKIQSDLVRQDALYTLMEIEQNATLEIRKEGWKIGWQNPDGSGAGIVANINNSRGS